MASEKIRSLQILRAVAAGMVVFVHAGNFAHDAVGAEWTWRFKDLGEAGVDIFFVLSGAIIYLTAFADRRQRPAEFLKRRFLRIAPLYYLITLAFLPFAAFSGYPATTAPAIGSFLFLPGLETATVPIINPGWSLCFELLFYAGAAAILASHRALYILPIAFAACFYLSLVTHIAFFGFFGNPMAFEFVVGFAIAWAWRRGFTVKWPIGLWLVGFAFLLLVPTGATKFYVVLVIENVLALPRLLLWGIPAAIIVFGALSTEHVIGDRWVRLPVYLGDASYSIYLAHWPAMVIALACVRRLGIQLAPAWLGISFGLLGLTVALLTYRFVEMPMRRAIARKRLSTFMTEHSTAKLEA